MKFRVGLDFNSDNWIDWGGVSYPNLLTNPLWFCRFPNTATNATIADRMEKTNYGLMVRRITTTTDAAAGNTLGSDIEKVPGSNGATFTYVVWVRALVTNEAVAVRLGITAHSALGTPLAPVYGPLVALTEDWQKLSFEHSSPIGSPGVLLSILRDTDESTVADIEITGVGVYDAVGTAAAAIDFVSGDGDGASEDITGCLLGLELDSGGSGDIGSMHPIDGHCTVTLDNTFGYWTPRNGEAPAFGRWLPRTLLEVQFRITENDPWEPLWAGFFDQIRVNAGTHSPIAKVEALQGLLAMGNTRLAYAPKPEQTVTEILNDVFEIAYVPANRFSWRLGGAKGAGARLGVSTHFADPASYTVFGDSTYVQALSGIGLDADTSLREFFTQLVTSDGGYSHIDREGQPVFRPRVSYFPGYSAGVINADVDAKEAEYVYGQHPFTEVSAKFYPRHPFDGVLWETSTEDPPMLDAGEYKEMTVSPETETGEKIITGVLEQFFIGTSVYQAIDEEDHDRTAEVILGLYQEGQKIRLTMRNTTDKEVTLSVTLRGAGYYVKETETLTVVSDPLLENNNGQRGVLMLDLRHVSDASEATLVCQRALTYSSLVNDGLRVIRYSFSGNQRDEAKAARVMALKVGDLVEIAEDTALGTTMPHRIVKEEISATPGSVKVTHYLIPINLGYSL